MKWILLALIVIITIFDYCLINISDDDMFEEFDINDSPGEEDICGEEEEKS